MTELSERGTTDDRAPVHRRREPGSYRAVGAGMVGAIVLVAAYFLPWLHALYFFGVAFACGAATPTALNLLLKGRGPEIQGELASETRPSDRAAARSALGRATKGRGEGHAEQQLLEAIERHGEITPARAALETPLSVAEADRMLGELAEKGHLEVQAREGRLVYSF